MTRVQEYKQREQRQRAQVVQWLGITEETLNELIYEGAFDYLRNVFGTDAYGMEHLPKTKEFWTWWRMEYNRIDGIFLNAIGHEYLSQYPQWYCVIQKRDSDVFDPIYSVDQLRKEYTKYHEASMRNRFINSSTVRAGAHDMINAIIAGQTKQQEVHHD